MNRVIIKQVKVGAFQVFTYIVACPETRPSACSRSRVASARSTACPVFSVCVYDSMLNAPGSRSRETTSDAP